MERERASCVCVCDNMIMCDFGVLVVVVVSETDVLCANTYRG